MNWFDVDKKGLAKLLEKKGKSFILYELIQNCWDEDTKKVMVTLQRVAGTRKVELIVEDDNPAGFANLAHAFTLFAESSKKDDVSKRGRFNLGEKLVLAMCHEATIASTTGTVWFEEGGRRTSKHKRAAGSMFRGALNMTNDELELCGQAVLRLLAPPGISTSYNGVEVAARAPLTQFRGTLETVIADSEGFMRKSMRETTVEVHAPQDGEPAMLYELGVPVVETGDRWHLNVMQKIPLTFDRDNVPAAYLSKVRAMAVEHMHADLTAEDANAPWVRDALARNGAMLSDATVNRLTELRFGDKRVTFDPTDIEANHIAVSQGYQLVYGAHMSGDEWSRVKQAGAIQPAGQVTPSAKPYSDDPNARPQTMLDREKWTPEIVDTVAYIERVSRALVGSPVSIDVTSDITWPFSAAYGRGRMVLNLGRLSHRWFDRSTQLESINDLVLHELGHHFETSHLSAGYHDALTKLGARMTALALKQPELFAASKSSVGS